MRDVERKEGREREIKRERDGEREEKREGEGERKRKGGEERGSKRVGEEDGVRKREGKREGEEEGESKGVSFSVAGALDALSGALLLYYLPNTHTKGQGEEIVKGKELAGVRGEERRGVEDIRERKMKVEEEGKNKLKYESVTAFCVIDLVWLLQLNDRDTPFDNNYNNNNDNGNSYKNTQNNPISHEKRTDSPNKTESRKGKFNEKATRDYYNTTTKIRETLDRAFFLENTLVVITKTFSTKILHRNDGISSVEVPVARVEVDELMVENIKKKMIIEEKKTNSLNVKSDNNERNNDKNENNKDNENKDNKNRKGSERDSDRSGMSRERNPESVDELKLIGGTIYVLNFTGKGKCVFRYKPSLSSTPLYSSSFFSFFFYHTFLSVK